MVAAGDCLHLYIITDLLPCCGMLPCRWELPANLTFLSWLAPQLLDNAALRYLLGRHTHCK
jgi:hypothetical protein